MWNKTQPEIKKATKPTISGGGWEWWGSRRLAKRCSTIHQVWQKRRKTLGESEKRWQRRRKKKDKGQSRSNSQQKPSLDRLTVSPLFHINKHWLGSTCGVTDAGAKGPTVLQQPAVDLGLLNVGQNSWRNTVRGSHKNRPRTGLKKKREGGKKECGEYMYKDELYPCNGEISHKGTLGVQCVHGAKLISSRSHVYVCHPV